MTRQCCLVRVLSCICLRTQELSKHWSRIPLGPCRSLLLPWSHIAPCTGPRPHPSIMFPPSTLHPPLTPPPVSHGSSSTLHPSLTRPQCHMASSTSFSLRHLPGCLPFPPQPTPLSSLLTYLLFLLCDVHPCSSINSV